MYTSPDLHKRTRKLTSYNSPHLTLFNCEYNDLLSSVGISAGAQQLAIVAPKDVNLMGAELEAWLL